MYFNCSEELEKVDEKQTNISDIKQKYYDILKRLFGDFEYGGYNLKLFTKEISNSIYTIYLMLKYVRNQEAQRKHKSAIMIYKTLRTAEIVIDF